VRAGEGQVLLWDALDEDNQIQMDTSPAQTQVGRLRLKRVGDTLHYLHAVGTEGDDFQEIHTWEFGTADVKQVELTGLTGRQPRSLRARFLELRIRSDAPSSGTAGSKGTGRFLVAIFAGAVLALGLLGIWFFARRTRQVAGAGR
jgi:hypothetical protein